jgi:hypothetical protein
MRFLLRLKHWQLFLLTWGLPITIDIYAFSDLELMVKLFPLMTVVFAMAVFGWIWAIAAVLHQRVPIGVNLNLTQFKVMFSIPIIYILTIVLLIDRQSFAGPNGHGEVIGFTFLPAIVVIHLVSMVCILLGMRFAAKTLKSIELGRNATFRDYAAEFFLIWFSPIGCWILQPRLNRLTDSPDPS